MFLGARWTHFRFLKSKTKGVRSQLFQKFIDWSKDILWLIESKAVSITAPHQTRKDIFSEGKKKKKCLESPSQKFFYVNNKIFKSIPNRSEKYSKITEVSNEKVDNCHSTRRLYELGKQPPGSILQNNCSEKMEKISRKTSVVVYSFWFYLKKTIPPRKFSWKFAQIF